MSFMPKCHLETGNVKLDIKPDLRMDSFTVSCFLFKYSWKPVQIQYRHRYIFQVTMCLTGAPWLFVVTLLWRNRLRQGEVRHAIQFRTMAQECGFRELPAQALLWNGGGSNLKVSIYMDDLRCLVNFPYR